MNTYPIALTLMFIATAISVMNLHSPNNKSTGNNRTTPSHTLKPSNAMVLKSSTRSEPSLQWGKSNIVPTSHETKYFSATDHNFGSRIEETEHSIIRNYDHLTNEEQRILQIQKVAALATSDLEDDRKLMREMHILSLVVVSAETEPNVIHSPNPDNRKP